MPIKNGGLGLRQPFRCIVGTHGNMELRVVSELVLLYAVNSSTMSPTGLQYRANNRGLSTDPWGTPTLRLTAGDYCYYTTDVSATPSWVTVENSGLHMTFANDPFIIIIIIIIIIIYSFISATVDKTQLCHWSVAIYYENTACPESNGTNTFQT